MYLPGIKRINRYFIGFFSKNDEIRYYKILPDVMLRNQPMNLVEFTFDDRLDTDFLNELYGGDKEHATMVFEQFLKEIHVQLKEIDNSYNSGNSELLRQKVHKLKPVFSFVGLTWLTDKAEAIENQCKQNTDQSAMDELYKDFTKNILEFIPIIENELVKLKE